MAVSIAFIARGSNGNLGANGSITVTGVTTSGASLILIHAGVGNNTASTVSSITVGGSNATLAKRQVMTDATSNTEVWWFWSTGALSSASVVVNFSNSSGAGADVQVCEATGTDASSIGNVGGANGSSGTTAGSATCSFANSVMFGGSLDFGSANTAGANTTVIDATSDGAGDQNTVANNTQATSVGTSYTITTTHTSAQWAIAVVEVKPAGSAIPVALPIPSIHPFMMRGPGRFRAGPKFRSNAFQIGAIGVLAGVAAISFAASATAAGQMFGTASISVSADTNTLTGSGALTGSSGALFSATLTPTIATRYPVIKVGRKMFDQQGAPFRIKGRTAWGIIGLSQSLMTAFLDDTAAHGFNAIECQMPCGLSAAPQAPFDGSGNLPFLKRLDNTTWTGAMPTYVSPHTESPDMSTVNSAFFANVDAVIQAAYQRNILVLFFPAYLGQGGFGGWIDIMQANIDVNGDTAVSNYGAFIANRYKSFPNIVWMTAGDTASGFDPENDLITGLQSVSGQASGPNFSSERNGGSISTDGSGVLGLSTTLNAAYDWATVITQCRRAYSFSTTIMPGFLLEEPYDQEGADGTGVNTTFSTQPVRRYEWWGWLNAIGGYVAGNGFVWRFALTGNGTTTDDYRNHLNTQNTQDLTRLNAFMEYWPNTNDLVPGTLNGMRTLVVSGAGTIDTGNFNCAAQTNDGSLLIAYVSPGGAATIGLDLRSMGGRRLRARWWDPTAKTWTTNASATGVWGDITNAASSQSFTTPGTNSTTTDSDWVLVIEEEPSYVTNVLHPFYMVGPGRKFKNGPKLRTLNFAQFAPATSLVGSATLTFASNSTLTGAGALAGAPTIAFGNNSTLTAAGALAGSTAITVAQTGAVTGAGTLNSTSAITFAQTGALTGAGAMTGSSAITFSQTGTLQLIGTTSITVGNASTLTGTGTLAGSTSLTFNQTGAVTGSGVLTGSSAITFSQTGYLQLIGTTSITFGSSTTLKGAGALAGSTSATFAQTGALAGSGAITGTTTATFGQTGTLTGAGALTGTSAAVFSASLQPSASMAGTAAITVGATGTVVGAGALTGSTAVTFNQVGTLSLIGTTAIVFSASTTLVGAGALAGSSAMSFGSSTTLVGAGVLAGSSASTFGSSTTLTASAALAGTTSFTFLGSASPNGSSAMIASTSIVFNQSGTAVGVGALTGTSNVVFASSSTLTGAGALTGTSAAVFSNSTALIGSGVLNGSTAITFVGSANVPAGALNGTSAIVFGSSTTLGGKGALSGATNLTIIGTGTPGGLGALAGTSNSTFTSSATLAGAGAVISTATGITIAGTGTMLGRGDFVGSAQITFDGSAAPTFSDGTRLISGTTTITLTLQSTASARLALQGKSSIQFGVHTFVRADCVLRGNVNAHFNAKAILGYIGRDESGNRGREVQVLLNGKGRAVVIR